MFLPLSDSPNPRGIPVVTYGIIAANVAVFLLISVPLGGTPADPGNPLLQEYVRILADHLGQRLDTGEFLRGISQYDLFVFQHGFRPAAPNPLSLLESLFLHAGFTHLFGNMLFLWIYGDNVEQRLGRMRFLFWYLLSGVAATLFHAAFFPASQLPLVGASGAISGVLGFYFRWFPHNRVRMLVFLFPFVLRVVPLSARLVLGIYLVLDNLMPFVLSRGGAGSGVAFGAHIGGFLAGLGAAWWMDRRALVVPDEEFGDGSHRPEADGSPAGQIRDALARNEMADAVRLYLSLDARSSRCLLEAEELLRLGDWLRDRGSSRSSLAVYLRLLRDYPAGPAAAAAHLGAGLAQLDLEEPTAAYQHLLDALDLDPTPQVERSARAALQAIEARQKFRLGGVG